MSAEESDAEASERLRLEGNSAFQSNDWEAAVDLYRNANQHKEDAKIYSNLAAALSKLDRLDEAKIAAERGIVIEPKWTKGWWRLGTVAEELQDFVLALSCFTKAAQLSPGDAGCMKSLKGILEKLDVPVSTRRGGAMSRLCSSPGYAAWTEAFTMVGGGSTFQVVDKYKAQPRVVQQMLVFGPTSRQYLVQGMAEWVNGLKRAIASLSITMHPQAKVAYVALMNRRGSYANSVSQNTHTNTHTHTHTHVVCALMNLVCDIVSQSESIFDVCLLFCRKK
jgi:tetratricopeptide (TPR) repeat protein